MEFTAQQIADLLQGEVEGDKSVKLNTFSKIEEGEAGSLTFLSNPKYTHFIYTTNASAVLVNKDFVPESPIKPTLIKVDDAYKALATLMRLAESMQTKKTSVIASNTSISSTATIGKEVSVGAYTVIEDDAEIGDNTTIYPQVYIGKNAKIGNNVILFPGVCIYKDCIVGNNCIIHANTVIGSDGFGFAPTETGVYEKIPQMGNVVIEDDVEIGSNTSVDRATMGSTLIKKGTKIDNLVQIAHNVEIGENTVIAAQNGIAGSTKVGKNCMFGGQVGAIGHIKIGDNVKVFAKTGITTDVPADKVWRGIPGYESISYNKAYSIFKKLPDLYKTIYQLEKEIKFLKEKNNE